MYDLQDHVRSEEYLEDPLWQRNLGIIPNIAPTCMEAHNSLDAQTCTLDHAEQLLIA